MKPASFDYHRPQTVAAALDLLARLGDTAKLIAGGQSLGPMLNMRLARPRHLVDLNDLIELDFVRIVDGALEIGAMTRHQRVATSAEVRRAHPLLAAAAATIGHYPIRQRGTLGGSLVHADPAAQMPLIAILANARIVIGGVGGTREIAACDFFQSVMTVDLRAGEIVTSVRFPVLAPNAGWGFRLFSRRHGDFAIVAVAATLSLDDHGRVADLRIAVGGVASVPFQIDFDAAAVRGEMPTPKWIETISAFVAGRILPEDNALVSAEYRRELTAALVRDGIDDALRSTQVEAA